MKRITFNNITILQSLGEKDLKTGQQVKDDINLYNAIYDRGIGVNLFDINDKYEFNHALDTLIIESKRRSVIPILQLDAHGESRQKGIILKSGDFIDWASLKKKLIELNIATKLNLMVVFSLCYGAYFTSQIYPPDRAPCWGLVGPVKAVDQTDLLKFSSFYKKIFENGSGGDAVNYLNENCTEDDMSYYFTTAASFFSGVYKNYLKKNCTKSRYKMRAKKLRKRLLKDKIANIPSINQFQRDFTSSQRSFFEKYKTLFFMIDLYPENKERFKICYKDILK